MALFPKARACEQRYLLYGGLSVLAAPGIQGWAAQGRGSWGCRGANTAMLQRGCGTVLARLLAALQGCWSTSHGRQGAMHAKPSQVEWQGRCVRWR